MPSSQKLNVRGTCYYLRGYISRVTPFVVKKTASPLPSFSSLCLSLFSRTSKKPASSTAQSVVFSFNHISVRHTTQLSWYSRCPLTWAESSSILFGNECRFPMMIEGRKGLYLNLLSVFLFFTRIPTRAPRLFLIST